MTTKDRATFLQHRFEEHYGYEQFIYSLNDPQTSERRYVGRSNNPQTRYQKHINDARRWSLAPPYQPKRADPEAWAARQEASQSSKKWIASLLALGLKPRLEILESVQPPVFVSEREMRWICQCIKEGCDLLNIENSREASRNLICEMDVESFLTVELDALLQSKFPMSLESLLGSRDTGWRRAVLIHTLYKSKQRITISGTIDGWY